jgi:hypothetical protein
LSTAGTVPPGYRRVAFLNETDAIVVFSFTGRYVPDDPS